MIKKIFSNISVFLVVFLIISVAADIYYYNRVIEKDAYPKGQICYSDFKVFWLAANNMRYHIVTVSDDPKKTSSFKPLWFLSPVYRANAITAVQPGRPGYEFKVYEKKDPFYHFRYSPFIAYIMIPFGKIKAAADALIIWYAILNTAFLFTLLILMKRLRVDFGLSDKRGFFILWLTFVIALRFYLMNIALGQTDIFVVFLLTLFLAAYIGHRFVICGILLALVLQLKPFFLPMLIYFLISGRAKIAISALISFAAFILFPSHLIGIADTISLIKDWIEILSVSIPSQILNIKNQSLIFFTGSALIKFYGNGYASGLFYFLSGLFTSCAYTLLYLARKRIYRRDGIGFAYLEISILIMISILFSPLAWEAYFISLVIPFAAVLAFVKNSADRRPIYAALFFFFILSCVVGTDLTKFIPNINNAPIANIAFGTSFLTIALFYSYRQKLKPAA